ncbi:hypothetical protein VPH35_046319 [Triticum aestivum]
METIYRTTTIFNPDTNQPHIFAHRRASLDLTERQCIPSQLSSSCFASSCHFIRAHAPVQRPRRATSPPASSPTASPTSPCPRLRATPGCSTPPSSTSGSISRASPGLPPLSCRSRGMN